MCGSGKFLLALILLLISSLLCAPAPAGCAQAAVELGSINIEHGLSCLNTGDGQTAATVIGGRECRTNDTKATPPSQYLYFDIDPEAIPPPIRPVYVTVEYYDQGFGSFSIQYDSRDKSASGEGAYKSCREETLLDSREWRRTIFELPDPRLDGRQANGADFRLVPTGSLYVSKVTVDTEKPADYESHIGELDERISKRLGGPINTPGIRVVVSGFDGFDKGALYDQIRRSAPILKAMGVSSVRTQVRWSTVEPLQGVWNWDFYDGLAAVLKENGLMWSPEIVLGTAGSVPDWFLTSPDFLQARCVEHDVAGSAQSVWSPSILKRSVEFIGKFANHFRGSGVVESVTFNVWNREEESVGVDVKGHNHTGLWCRDEVAVENFRHYLKNRYSGAPARLNAAWGTSIKSFDQILPFTYEEQPSPYAWIDEISWYRGRVTRLMDLLLAEARAHFGPVPLYIRINTGSTADPGCDTAGLAKTAARHGAGLWIVQDGREYATAFAYTRPATAAAKLYNARAAVEITGSLQEFDHVVHAYNGTTSVCLTYCQSLANLTKSPQSIDSWKAGAALLRPETSKRSVAVYVPDNCCGDDRRQYIRRISLLRDGFDYDIIEDRAISDRVLDRYHALVWMGNERLSEKTASAIIDWVKKGGTFVGVGAAQLYSTGKTADLEKLLLPEPESETTSKKVGAGTGIRIRSDWSSENDVVREISRVLNGLSIRVGRTIAPDGEVDQIYVTCMVDKLLVLNMGERKVERAFTTGVGQRTMVSIPARSVIEVPIAKGDSNAEKLQWLVEGDRG